MQGEAIVERGSRQKGDTSCPSAAGLMVDTFPESAGENAIGTYLMGIDYSRPAYDAFLAKWAVKYGGEPPARLHPFAYDAANLLRVAIAQAAVQEADGTLHIGRQALRDALAGISGLEGLTGTLDCGLKSFAGVQTSRGDCSAGGSIVIRQITAAEVFQDKWFPDIVYP